MNWRFWRKKSILPELTEMLNKEKILIGQGWIKVTFRYPPIFQNVEFLDTYNDDRTFVADIVDFHPEINAVYLWWRPLNDFE